MKFEYPAVIIPDETGGFMAQAPDIPEAFGFGIHEEEALEELARSIAVALILYINRHLKFPQASETEADEYLCRLSMPDSARIALRLAMSQQGMTPFALAGHMDLDPEEVQNLIEIGAPLDFSLMEKALLLSGIDYEINFHFEVQGLS